MDQQQSATPVAPASGLNGSFPAELNRWNWGAFFLTWIWGIGNSVWIALVTLLAFIPLIGPVVAIVMAITLGLKGNEWAWQHRKFESVEQFKKIQHTWAIWGLVIFIVGLVVGFAFIGTLSAFLLHTSK